MPTNQHDDPTDRRTVRIPGSQDHAGHHLITVTLPWVCPACGGPRGEITPAISYDGSRRLGCDAWTNPCGHLDTYAAIRLETAIGRASAPGGQQLPLVDRT
ncbi:hypothetical protein [Nakamurella sp.]|uniref:hypothetical protein n=1 Tax=Nakamurella sp. TaxID=1869182 RepID=UPI003B3BA962